jgi:hypothetical protein
LNETNIQASRQSRTKVLAKRESNAIYRNIPKSWEWITINCAINAVDEVLLRFYIFKKERLRNDSIKFCKLNTCIVMQKKAWMICFLFKEFLFFFKWFTPSGMFLTNQHLLILDGHGFLEAIDQAQKVGLIMITLPSHTFHVI